MGKTGVPAVILGDDSQIDFPRLPLSPGDVGVLSSISVALMSVTSRKRGSAGNGHCGFHDSYGFSPDEFYPGRDVRG